MRFFAWGDLSPPNGYVLAGVSVGGLLALSVSTGSVQAQLADHDRIEALFAALATVAVTGGRMDASQPSLGVSPPAAQSAIPTAGAQPLGPDAGLPPPMPVTAIPFADQGTSERGSEIFAYDLPSGNGCPGDPTVFRESVDVVEQIRAQVERRVADIEETFLELSEEMIEMRKQDTLECSKAIKDDIEDLATDTASFDAGETLAEIENLNVCAQEAATEIGLRMAAIPESAPAAEMRRRVNLSRALDEASRQDGRLTSVMISMATLRQKQIRIADAVEVFRGDCAFGEQSIYGDGASPSD